VSGRFRRLRRSTPPERHQVRLRRAGAEEKRMLGVLTQLAREEDAQDLIEYSLLCALLAVACITGILQLTQILQFFAMVGAILRAAI
jgi:Flp pilus assembly pilin Flp